MSRLQWSDALSLNIPVMDDGHRILVALLDLAHEAPDSALSVCWRDLLAHTGERVSSIAHRVGFSDEAYFSRRFSQRFGIAPTAYRRSIRQTD